ncbi:MAG: hypothetical protein RSE20_08105 [Eubacterium sp.]
MNSEFLEGLGLEEDIINKILSENKTDIKAESDKVPEDYEDIKKELKDLKLSLEENDKGDDPESEALRTAKSLEQNFLRKLAELKVKEVFVGGGLVEDDYKDLLGALVTDDEVESAKRAQDLVNLLSAKTEATETLVREKILQETPPPPGDEDNDGDVDTISFAKKMAEENGKKYMKE